MNRVFEVEAKINMYFTLICLLSNISNLENGFMQRHKTKRRMNVG